METSVNVAVIYDSATSGVFRLAKAAATAAGKTGPRVRLRKVRELALDEAIATNQGWSDHSAHHRGRPRRAGMGRRHPARLADPVPSGNSVLATLPASIRC